MLFTSYQLALWLLVAAQPSKAAPSPHFKWPPTVKSAEILGNASDDALNRDSCGSTRFFDRELWVCRDTQPNIAPGQPHIYPVYASTASWTDFDKHQNPLPKQYGGDHSYTSYYAYANDECPPPGPLQIECAAGEQCPGPLQVQGTCSDYETRYALWPDSPPLITSQKGGRFGLIEAYTFVKKTWIRSDLSTVVNDPATSLYKVSYDAVTRLSNPNALPKTAMIEEEFWKQDALPFGAYGNIVKDGTAYLFAQPSNHVVALARVPVQDVTNISKYEYLVNGTWGKEQPGINATNINIPNVSAGGQGTYFFSQYWNKFVWIGQSYPSVTADFYITAADNIEGPWETPVHFYSGINGDYFLSAYTLQAHPGLSPGGVVNGPEVYISYTKNDAAFGTNVYTQPLIRITWN